jgi:hypothetical protein
MIPAMLASVIPALALPWLLLPLRHPLLFAVVPTLPLAVVYARAIAARRPRFAASLALAWAVALSVSTVVAAAVSPDAAMRAIWHAGPYRDEMLYWIATGSGAEGSIGRFLPRVLIEYALVLAFSAATAGVGALLLGSLLLGYMNGYVGWVVAHADPRATPLVAALLAWPPWSMARVVSFVLAGTAAATWGYTRIFDRKGEKPSVGPILTASLVLLAADILLKWRMAPVWRGFLRALLGASAGIEAGGSG